MRRQEIISTIEKDILSAENNIATIRASMPKPTLSMNAKIANAINDAWTKIEVLNKRIVELRERLVREKEIENINAVEIAVWNTSEKKWQCQLSDSYKRYLIIENNGTFISNCPDKELSARFIEAITAKIAREDMISREPKTPKEIRPATIIPGQRFYAPSDKKPAVWEVYERIKNESENIIRCKVIDGAPQDRTYIGQQFGYLIRQGIIKLIGHEGGAA